MLLSVGVKLREVFVSIFVDGSTLLAEPETGREVQKSLLCVADEGREGTCGSILLFVALLVLSLTRLSLDVLAVCLLAMPVEFTLATDATRCEPFAFTFDVYVEPVVFITFGGRPGVNAGWV